MVVTDISLQIPRLFPDKNKNSLSKLYTKNVRCSVAALCWDHIDLKCFFQPTINCMKSVMLLFSLTSLQNVNFPWLKIKFPDFSLILKNFILSWPFSGLWQPWLYQLGCNYGNCEEQLPLTDCRSTGYQQTTDRPLTAHRQVTDSFQKQTFYCKTEQ